MINSFYDLGPPGLADEFKIGAKNGSTGMHGRGEEMAEAMRNPRVLMCSGLWSEDATIAPATSCHPWF
jgi:hypothetical protein